MYTPSQMLHIPLQDLVQYGDHYRKLQQINMQSRGASSQHICVQNNSWTYEELCRRGEKKTVYKPQEHRVCYEIMSLKNDRLHL